MTIALRSVHVNVAAERLTLFAERAAYWPRLQTLLIADPHWGKAAAFRSGAIPVPRGTTAEGLARLDGLVEHTGAARIIVLGDFLHAREGRAPETLRALSEWRERHPRLELVLVRGNHDRGAGDPPPELGFTAVNAPLLEPPFIFVHHPVRSEGGYVVSGHLHPGVRLAGPGGLRERLPCFWFGEQCAVLPAFGDFTGLAPISPRREDRVFVVAENEVMEVPSLGSRNPTP